MSKKAKVFIAVGCILYLLTAGMTLLWSYTETIFTMVLMYASVGAVVVYLGFLIKNYGKTWVNKIKIAQERKKEEQRIVFGKNDADKICDFGNKVFACHVKSKSFGIFSKKHKALSKQLKFKQIKKFEVVENNESKVSCSLGQAIIGDWLFGTIGGIAGAVSGSSVEEYCNDLRLFVYLDDIECPMVEFTYINNPVLKKSSYYKKAFTQIKENCALLENIITTK